ncbi:hypothetical protein [Stenotrophomonas nematodicola]|jgi:hypothetical protein|uniref:hypothetical protein n=1 Tax=Stenotrophomonas nematodicola TaxID=2656746 RepID=UPI003D9AAB69
MAEAPTVASTVRDMRRAGAAGEPVPADVVQLWVQTFMTQLYGTQTPIRYECRPRYTTEPWQLAETADVMHWRRRNLEIRALYLHPSAGKHKDHRWPAGSNGEGQCLECGETEWLAGPDCKPHAQIRDHRSDTPFSLTWLIEPLEKLQYLTKHMNPLDRAKWRTETTYLIDRIKDHAKGSPP